MECVMRYELSVDPSFSYETQQSFEVESTPLDFGKRFSDLGVEYIGLVYFLVVGLLIRRWFSGRAEDYSKNLMRIALILLLVLGVYATFFVMLLWNVPLSGVFDKVRDGTFGDSFGTLNTLFSGFAFSGIIITILMQKSDLAESRKQIGQQQVESQFYNILSLQQQVISGFDLHVVNDDSSIKTIQGRDCFRDWRRKLKTRYQIQISRGVEPSLASQAAYQSVLKSHLGDLGLYFRSLYSVFRFIETLEKQDQKKYSVVVRSLLSDYELFFLFYNCLSPMGARFSRYAQVHALFDNLNISLLLNKQDVVKMKESVYGQNMEALSLHAELRIS